MSFNEKGKPIDGNLQSDRPWVVKIQPAYILPWGTMAGAEIDVEAGLPMTSSVTFTGVPVYVFGRNDLGQLPTFSYVNLNFQQEFRLPKNMRGDRRVQHRQPVRSGDGDEHRHDALPRRLKFNQCSGGTAAANRDCADRAFFAGFDTKAVMAPNNAASPNTRPAQTRATRWPRAGRARVRRGSRCGSRSNRARVKTRRAAGLPAARFSP